MLIREAAVYVVVLMLPLAFAAFVWPARRIWAIRMVELLTALILSKFAVVAVLSLAGAAFGATGGTGPTTPDGDGARHPVRLRPMGHRPAAAVHRARRGGRRGDPVLRTPSNADDADGGRGRRRAAAGRRRLAGVHHLIDGRPRARRRTGRRTDTDAGSGRGPGGRVDRAPISGAVGEQPTCRRCGRGGRRRAGRDHRGRGLPQRAAGRPGIESGLEHGTHARSSTGPTGSADPSVSTGPGAPPTVPTAPSGAGTGTAGGAGALGSDVGPVADKPTERLPGFDERFQADNWTWSPIHLGLHEGWPPRFGPPASATEPDPSPPSEDSGPTNRGVQ